MLTSQILELEQQFGYKENPEKEDSLVPNKPKKKPDLVKIGKESYGVRLSLEYKKALAALA